MDEIRITGEIQDIIYQNEQNSYTVCTVTCEEGNVTAVGYLPYVTAGEQVALVGEWVTHPDYGEQFKVYSFEKLLPTTTQSILLYLSSGIIHGVREATAKKIVDAFGENSLEVILSDWQSLASIKGISVSKASDIHASFVERQSVQQTVMFLQPFGVTAEFAMKVHRHLGASAVDKIKQNPYVLCDEISGIGFRTADRIASEMGISGEHPGRLKSGLLYVLGEGITAGHTYLPKPLLLARAAGILEVPEEALLNEYTNLLFDGRIFEEVLDEYTAVYLPAFKNAESGIAARIRALSGDTPLCSPKKFSAFAKEAAGHLGITLSSEQSEAIRYALCHHLFVITGGPGTGKTTIINCFIDIMERIGLSVALCAPTGRAAKRISECTAREASTLHRLLGMDYSTDDSIHFLRNECDPLRADVIIVDEMSMVDTLLFHALLKACRAGTRLIMVGDDDQLPSVGAGNVLSYLIQSECVPVCRLTQIYRQAAESMIVQNAHRINRGEELLTNGEGSDFFFMKRQGAADVSHTVCDLASRRLPNAYGFDPMTDTEVLSPMRKGPSGVNALNVSLQKELNPPSRKKAELPFRDGIFREGDKVMQIRNNYELYWSRPNGDDGLGIFNGDVGLITHIDPHERTISVLFDGERQVMYDSTQFDELELAYATTIHKSQGSEFPAVIIVLHGTSPKMMQKNLLYTAVTRAKDLVVIVGSIEIAQNMIQGEKARLRYTGLASAIREGNAL